MCRFSVNSSTSVMAAALKAALSNRDSCAAKLEGSIRQLRRYLDSASVNPRILQQKIDKVSIDQEELINAHHAYGEKSETELLSETMSAYLNPKIDAAADILDEAEEKLDELSKVKETESALVEANSKRDMELTKAKQEIFSNTEVVRAAMSNLKLAILKEEPSESDVTYVDSVISDIQTREKELKDAWLRVHSLETSPNEIRAITEEESTVRAEIYKTCSQGQQFVSINKKDTVVSNQQSTVAGKSNIEKMHPPKFSGSIRDFARFKSEYDAIVKPSYSNPVHQMHVLKNKCLQNEALELVKNLTDLDSIWKRLTDKYGNAVDIVDAVIQDIQSFNIPKNSRDRGFVDFVGILEKGVQDLTAIRKESEIASAYTVRMIEAKIPQRTHLSWLEHLESKEDTTTTGYDKFMLLIDYLKKERKRIERVLSVKPGHDREKENPRKHINHLGTGADSQSGTQPRNLCLIHPNSRHLTRKCEIFKKKTVTERCQLVKDMNACPLCLTVSHQGTECPRKSTFQPCDIDSCNKYHSRMLHGCTVVGLQFHIQLGDHLQLHTLLLFQTVTADSEELVIFWDNGSQVSLVTRRYARKHQLHGVHVTYDLVTINDVQHQETILYEVPIKDRSGNTHIIKAFEIEKICEDTDSVNLKEVVKLFHHLKKGDVERPKRQVDLLIGMNYTQLHPDKIAKRGSLALFESQFGTGRILGGNHKAISSNRKLSAHARIVAKASVNNVRVSKGVDFFTAESFGVNVPPKCKDCRKGCKECKLISRFCSRAEQAAHQVMVENLELNPVTEQWQTKYAYLEDPMVLCKDGDNREQAIGIMIKTENRLKKQPPENAENYCAQFSDFVGRGVFKQVSEDELTQYKGPKRYISHHEVFKEDSASTPVRLVLNSSLKFNGLSLNDILLRGPNALNSLWEVQLRFRSYIVALVCDLTKMYQSIKTTELERFLRLVVWRDMKSNEKPKTYTTETMMFGDKPAAAISAIALKETAELYKYIDEEAATKIKEDMYVDDIATGDSSVEKVERLKENITTILGKANFHVKFFVTSGDQVQENIAMLGTGEVGRVLGIGWDPATDTFVVQVCINLSKKVKGARTQPDLTYDEIPRILSMVITLRILLGVTNSCYDAYGFFAPLTIQLKIELRDLYRLKLGWDDDIPHEKKQIWCEILQRLKLAEKVTFKRCVVDENSVGDPELIVFCDGSPSAMCAVIYIRWTLANGKFDVRLVSAKTRVTPIQRMTTPRAEIQAAVLGVRLCKSVVESLHLNFREPIFLSDSTCTLATLCKENTLLNEFFGNRQDECLGYTNKSQWFHVNTDDNIADLGTKMNAIVEDIKEGSEWQIGPQWLYQTRDKWPITRNFSDVDVPKEALLLAKKMCNIVKVINTLWSDVRMLAHTYSFLMRTTARIFHVFEKKSFLQSEITPACLEKAELHFLKESMRRTQVELEKGNLVPLRPQKDGSGVICLSSRAVKGFKLNYNNDRLPILTTKDPLAYLWMKHVHAEDHTGVTRTLAKSRRKYWIIRGGRLSRKIRRECYTCRKLDKEMAGQLMAPLPDFRLASSPVFDVTSMDLTGPLMIKDTVKKRTHTKVWGVIFTCASTRAVYLDITESYSTDSILQTIRKFVTMRGYPSEMISDQGSQLRAASSDITKDWNWSIVSDWASNNKMKWTVVPAEGQHQNGLSESMIKSTKRSILHMIGDNILTFSELQLAFYEITNVINSRPIGVVPNSDPDCPTPITPNDLLLGRASNEVPSGPFDTKPSITKRFRFVQELVDDWWKKWHDLVLPSLVPSYKWTTTRRNVQVGDICLIRYKGMRSKYRLGRVIIAHAGQDDLVRRVTLQYRLAEEKCFRTVDRSVHGISVIVPIEEQS